MTDRTSFPLRGRLGLQEMCNSRIMGRVVTAAAVVIATAAVAVVLLRGGGGTDYRVHALFQNAGQIVKGDLVQVAGVQVGNVTDIALTDDGQAELDLRITDPDYAPLRQGTLATVRQASLSGVANRYIDLRMPPTTKGQRNIPDGGRLSQTDTTSAVDLDQLFDTFNPQTRRALSGLIQGSANQYQGKGAQANAGLLYLNPSLAATRRLFEEVDRDTPALEGFLLSSSSLVTDLASRRRDLTGLVDHLATTTDAIGDRQRELARAINVLPRFLRRADSTFVDLRQALDDLDPLVNESKPVAKKLRPFLAALRPLARDARPTLRDLSVLVRRAGADNDLIELTRGAVPVRDAALNSTTVEGKPSEGAFQESTKALGESVPELAYARPYSVDLTGWFDDFSHSGIYDALGGASRASPHVNAFAILNGVLTPIPQDQRGPLLSKLAVTGQRNRCPGSAERSGLPGGRAFKPSPDYNCDDTQVPPGP